MKGSLLAQVGLVGLVLGSAWLIGGALSHGSQSIVYSVAEVEQGLGHDPDTWLGRTISVRGLILIYHERLDRDTITAGIELRDARLVTALSLTYSRPERMVAALRVLPLVGRWLTPSQALQPGKLVIYRVRLTRVAGGGCAPCYQAVLLDSELGPGPQLAPTR